MGKSNDIMCLSPNVTVEDSLFRTDNSCKQDLELHCSSKNYLREDSTDAIAPDICLTPLETTSVIRHRSISVNSDIQGKNKDADGSYENQKQPFFIPLSPILNYGGAEKIINLSPRTSPLKCASLFGEIHYGDDDSSMLSRSPAFDEDESDDQDMFHIVKYKDMQMRERSLSFEKVKCDIDYRDVIMRSPSFDEYDV